MGVITDKLGAELKQQKDLHTFLEKIDCIMKCDT